MNSINVLKSIHEGRKNFVLVRRYSISHEKGDRGCIISINIKAMYGKIAQIKMDAKLHRVLFCCIFELIVLNISICYLYPIDEIELKE